MISEENPVTITDSCAPSGEHFNKERSEYKCVEE